MEKYEYSLKSGKGEKIVDETLPLGNSETEKPGIT